MNTEYAASPPPKLRKLLSFMRRRTDRSEARCRQLCDSACVGALAILAMLDRTRCSLPPSPGRYLISRLPVVSPLESSCSSLVSCATSNASSTMARCPTARSSVASPRSRYLCSGSLTLPFVGVSGDATGPGSRGSDVLLKPYPECGAPEGLIIEVHLPKVAVLSAAALHVTPKVVKIPKQFEVALPFPVDRTPVHFGFNRRTRMLHINLVAAADDVSTCDDDDDVSVGSVDGWINLPEGVPPVRQRGISDRSIQLSDSASDVSGDRSLSPTLGRGCALVCDSSNHIPVPPPYRLRECGELLFRAIQSEAEISATHL
eukprot:TRINITY_DN547_c1_g1_i1.p1 TRINITY_DN547_c1_g1~~TRINITY_DN547_c1_g1_i1.p1  ORF type:complete len:317 (+),score=20.35 TRINITY_DN547_c1_g1_i1:419-1369(+)